jgi:predicted O-methyltransferase YrrM
MPDDPAWQAVDRYFCGLLSPDDAALTSALDASRAAGLPEIQVAPNQGKLLMLLALAVGARRVLEVGTLGGYSSIWLARGLPPGGRVVTLELEPAHARVARENLARAGLGERVEVRTGPALDLLAAMDLGRDGPFDLAFIDADKQNAGVYFDHAVRLCRPGALVIVDNVVRGGVVVDASSTDPNVRGIRDCLERMAGDSRVRATALQTVGSKGHDGLAIAIVV